MENTLGNSLGMVDGCADAPTQIARPVASMPAAQAPAQLGNRDFDFVLGNWHVRSHRLTAPMTGSTQWTTGIAEQRAIPILNGLGNQDEFLVDGQPLGGSLRLFDLDRKQWSIYWVATRDGLLQPPVVGAFQGNRGVFEGDDTFLGKPIRARYTWTGTDSANPRWEQAFSGDAGNSWEVNWVMEFSRHPFP